MHSYLTGRSNGTHLDGVFFKDQVRPRLIPENTSLRRLEWPESKRHHWEAVLHATRQGTALAVTTAQAVWHDLSRPRSTTLYTLDRGVRALKNIQVVPLVAALVLLTGLAVYRPGVPYQPVVPIRAQSGDIATAILSGAGNTMASTQAAIWHPPATKPAAATTASATTTQALPGATATPAVQPAIVGGRGGGSSSLATTPSPTITPPATSISNGSAAAATNNLPSSPVTTTTAPAPTTSLPSSTPTTTVTTPAPTVTPTSNPVQTVQSTNLSVPAATASVPSVTSVTTPQAKVGL